MNDSETEEKRRILARIAALNAAMNEQRVSQCGSSKILPPRSCIAQDQYIKSTHNNSMESWLSSERGEKQQILTRLAALNSAMMIKNALHCGSSRTIKNKRSCQDISKDITATMHIKDSISPRARIMPGEPCYH